MDREVTDPSPPAGDMSAGRAADAAAALAANPPLVQALMLGDDETTFSSFLADAGGDARRMASGFLALVRSGLTRPGTMRDGEALYVRQSGAAELVQSLRTFLSTLSALPARQLALRPVSEALALNTRIKPSHNRIWVPSLLPATREQIVADSQLLPTEVDAWIRSLLDVGVVSRALDGTITAPEITLEAVLHVGGTDAQLLLQALRPGWSDGLPVVPTGRLKAQIVTVLRRLQERGMVVHAGSGWGLTPVGRRLMERTDEVAGVTGRLLRALSRPDAVRALVVLAARGTPDAGLTESLLEERAGMRITAGTFPVMAEALVLERRTDGLLRLPGGPEGALARAAVTALVHLAALAEQVERAIPSRPTEVPPTVTPTPRADVPVAAAPTPTVAGRRPARPARRSLEEFEDPLALLGEIAQYGHASAHQIATLLEEASVAAGMDDAQARAWVPWNAIVARVVSDRVLVRFVKATVVRLMNAGLVDHGRLDGRRAFALTPGGRELLRRGGELAGQHTQRARTRAGLFAAVAEATDVVLAVASEAESGKPFDVRAYAESRGMHLVEVRERIARSLASGLVESVEDWLVTSPAVVELIEAAAQLRAPEGRPRPSSPARMPIAPQTSVQRALRADDLAPVALIAGVPQSVLEGGFALASLRRQVAAGHLTEEQVGVFGHHRRLPRHVLHDLLAGGLMSVEQLTAHADDLSVLRAAEVNALRVPFEMAYAEVIALAGRSTDPREKRAFRSWLAGQSPAVPRTLDVPLAQWVESCREDPLRHERLAPEAFRDFRRGLGIIRDQMESLLLAVTPFSRVTSEDLELYERHLDASPGLNGRANWADLALAQRYLDHLAVLAAEEPPPTADDIARAMSDPRTVADVARDAPVHVDASGWLGPPELRMGALGRWRASVAPGAKLRPSIERAVRAWQRRTLVTRVREAVDSHATMVPDDPLAAEMTQFLDQTGSSLRRLARRVLEVRDEAVTDSRLAEVEGNLAAVLAGFPRLAGDVCDAVAPAMARARMMALRQETELMALAGLSWLTAAELAEELGLPVLEVRGLARGVAPDAAVAAGHNALVRLAERGPKGLVERYPSTSHRQPSTTQQPPGGKPRSPSPGSRDGDIRM